LNYRHVQFRGQAEFHYVLLSEFPSHVGSLFFFGLSRLP
jgi:hypothetical protein